MHSALIISSTKKSVSSLTEMLLENSYKEVAGVHNCCEARRLLMSRDFDLHIINAPLADEFGESLACDIAAKDIAQVILIVKSEVFNIVSEKVENFGVLTIAKPINKSMFWSALKLANAAHSKMSHIQDENRKLIQKIEDIRIVDRAKCILIEYLSLTEAEAHRHIEKSAMDMRMTRKEVAQGIIKAYEN